MKLLGIAPVMQPSPGVNPGGDCYACAAQGLLSHLFPERQPDFAFASALFHENGYAPSDPTHVSNTWPGWNSAMWKARTLGYPVEVHEDVVGPHFEPRRNSCAWLWSVQSREYALRLEAWLSAGWVAATAILFDGGGPLEPDFLNHPTRRLRDTDHWVLLDGVDFPLIPHPTLPSARDEIPQIHVVCPVRGAYWIRATDLILWHGAGAWWLVRRDDRV